MEIPAVLAPSRGNATRRQDQLSEKALDLLAWAFREGCPASDIAPVPMNAAEVKIGSGDIDSIIHGGEGFLKHGGSDSLRYMKHADDEGWALVFAHDCMGDADKGAEIALLYDSI